MIVALVALILSIVALVLTLTKKEQEEGFGSVNNSDEILDKISNVEYLIIEKGKIQGTGLLNKTKENIANIITNYIPGISELFKNHPRRAYTLIKQHEFSNYLKKQLETPKIYNTVASMNINKLYNYIGYVNVPEQGVKPSTKDFYDTVIILLITMVLKPNQNIDFQKDSVSCILNDIKTMEGKDFLYNCCKKVNSYGHESIGKL